MHAFLVYSPDNKNVAENIAINLKKAGIEISHDTRRISNRMDEYKSFSTHASAPIILIVSDNFLKDKECMYESLNFLQNPALKNRIFPVVTDGRKVDSLDNVSYSHTKFERVSSVIHYMNYWQDQYLEMRKIKRDALVENEEAFNNDLQIIRSISSEIGEFLRILRSSDYTDFEALHKNKFETFFRRSGWNNAYSNFRDVGIVPFVKEDTEKIEIDLATIPGINLIPDLTKEEEASAPEKATEVKTEEQPKEEILVSEITKEVVQEKMEAEGSPLLNKVSDYKKAVQEEIPEIPKEAMAEKINEKEDFEKEGISYQDKSSYDLLVSLFEDDEVVEKETETKEVLENSSFIKEGTKPLDPIPAEPLSKTIEEKPKAEEPIVEEKPIIEEASEKKEIAAIIKETAKKEKEETSVYETELNDASEEIVQIEEELERIPEAHDVESIKAILEEGDLVEALRMLKEVLTIEPGNSKARYEYAMILGDKLHNYKEAKNQLGIILSLDSNNIQAHLRLAELNELTEDYKQAKRHYEALMVLDYEYPGLHHKYASLLNNNFKAQKRNAIKHYKIAVQQDAENVDALYQYAVMQYEFLGKPKKALKKFQKVIQKEPNHPFANYDISVLYYEMDKPKLAAQYYYDAYQNNPELKTDKNDEAFKVNQYLFAPKEETVIEEEIAEDEKEETVENEVIETEEILDEIYLDDVSDLTGTYELTHVPEAIDTEVVEATDIEDFEEDNLIEENVIINGVLESVTPNPSISYERIEELLEEDDSFEDLEDEIEEETTELTEEVEEIEAEISEEIEEKGEAPVSDEGIPVLGEIPNGKLGVASDVVSTTIEEEETPVEIAEPIAEEEDEEEIFAEPTTLALITGATSGIGKATAHMFARNGHSLIITGRRADRLEKIKQELEKKYNVSVETLEFDVRSIDACKKALDSLDERFKNVDILVNNAGLAKGMNPIHEGNIDHWETMIDTNIKGLLYMTRLVAPGMVAKGKGHIINIGSIAGKEVYPNGNVYCATKHAVDALTKSMRIDLHKYNIKVSAVNPGAVEETEFSIVRYDYDESKARKYQDFTPVNARDIAEIIYFVSTRPPHVNIQDLLVMGTQQATATITDKSGRK